MVNRSAGLRAGPPPPWKNGGPHIGNHRRSSSTTPGAGLRRLPGPGRVTQTVDLTGHAVAPRNSLRGPGPIEEDVTSSSKDRGQRTGAGLLVGGQDDGRD